jgi:hypothetical protein
MEDDVPFYLKKPTYIRSGKKERIHAMPLKAFSSMCPLQHTLWKHPGILFALLGLLVSSFFLSSCQSDNASQVWSKAFASRKMPATLSLVYDDDLTQTNNSAWEVSYGQAYCTYNDGDYTVSTGVGPALSHTVAAGCPRQTETGSTAHYYAFQLTIKDVVNGFAGLLFNSPGGEAFVINSSTYGFYDNLSGTTSTPLSATVSGTLPHAVTFPLHVGLIYDGKCHYYVNGQEVNAGPFQKSCPGDFGVAIVGTGAVTDITEATFWQFS